jgi:hypothetical protein
VTSPEKCRNDALLLIIGFVMLVVTLAGNVYALLETRQLRHESSRLDACSIRVIQTLQVRAKFQNDLREVDESDQKNIDALVNDLLGSTSREQSRSLLTRYNTVAKSNALKRDELRTQQAKYPFPVLSDCTGKEQ